MLEAQAAFRDRQNANPDDFLGPVLPKVGTSLSPCGRAARPAAAGSVVLVMISPVRAVGVGLLCVAQLMEEARPDLDPCVPAASVAALEPREA